MLGAPGHGTAVLRNSSSCQAAPLTHTAHRRLRLLVLVCGTQHAVASVLKLNDEKKLAKRVGVEGKKAVLGEKVQVKRGAADDDDDEGAAKEAGPILEGLVEVAAEKRAIQRGDKRGATAGAHMDTSMQLGDDGHGAEEAFEAPADEDAELFEPFNLNEERCAPQALSTPHGCSSASPRVPCATAVRVAVRAAVTIFIFRRTTPAAQLARSESSTLNQLSTLAFVSLSFWIGALGVDGARGGRRRREHGYFDANGNYVEYKEEKHSGDAWLEGVKVRVGPFSSSGVAEDQGAQEA
jgi:hypothetical protein